jgi:threonine/homoserine/homoserine lactone efflux protein
MVPLDTWLLFAFASVALAITPGPNLRCLVSRTQVQGRAAGRVRTAFAGLAARPVFDARR